MASDWIVYIIANTVDPYGYELPVILAYPNGFLYRARFKTEWLDSALIADLQGLQGSTCLIVYRHFETGDLYPIRYGILRQIEKYGEVVYIEYELDSIVQFHNIPELRRQQLAEFREKWKTEHPVASATNAPNDHMRPLVLRSKYVPVIENPYLPNTNEAEQEFESWSNTCDLISDVPLYQGMEFLRIVQLDEDVNRGNVAPKESRYSLKPGREYNLRIAQRVFRAPGSIRPHEVKFDSRGRGVRPITQQRRAVGRYDVLSFRFETEKAISRSAAGVLSLVGKMTEGVPFELEILIRVSPEWPIRGMFLATLGGAALLWPELFVQLGIIPEARDIIQRIGTLLFVIGVMDSRSLFDYISNG